MKGLERLAVAEDEPEWRNRYARFAINAYAGGAVVPLFAFTAGPSAPGFALWDWKAKFFLISAVGWTGWEQIRESIQSQ